MFSLKFICNDSEDGLNLEPEFSDSNDIISFLYELCNTLSSLGNSEFLISGFGKDKWPVDVETDLPILIEQLHELVSFLYGKRREVNISLYEQGIECDLFFKKQDEDVHISCQGFGNWQPQSSSEIMEFDKFKLMIDTFINDFCTCVKYCLPNYSSNKVFKSLLMSWSN